MHFAGLIIVVALASIASFAATLLVYLNAARLGLIQAPNARSSHTIPTPSGGGIGIVLGGSIAAGFATIFAPWPLVLLLLTAGAIAAIGFYDDRKPLPALFRLGAQLVLVAIAVWFVAQPAALAQAMGLPLPEAVLAVLAVLAVVYWINLFNFMDGIDGLAASEAIFMSCSAALLAAINAPEITGQLVFWTLLGLAGASLGFLALNWPPAKIFMGDAGSTYLGFMLGLLALLTVAAGWVSLWQWLILAAAFVTDASVTLVRRLLGREKIFEAHRRHTYQILSRRWGSHRKVTLAFIALNLLWLLPLAWLAGEAGCAIPSVLIAYLPLIGLALICGAGRPEPATAPRAQG